jgi:protein-tyrosine phosphatase
MKKILFVCTGNIFRSLAAEYICNNYLSKKGLTAKYKAESAGTMADLTIINPYLFKALLSKGVDPSRHKQRKLSKRMIMEVDFIVAMAENQKKFIKEKFELDVPLFNEVCYNKQESILDVSEAIPDYLSRPEESKRYFIEIVDYLQKAMPSFMKNIGKFGIR